jgi:hypothetical protein
MIVCKECGTHETGSWTESIQKEMKDWSVCFTCWHWLDLIRKSEAETKWIDVRVSGTHYQAHKELNQRMRPPGATDLGFGGRLFRIAFHDDTKITTNNLWCQGRIPEHFRDRLPDNAVFERTLVNG